MTRALRLADNSIVLSMRSDPEPEYPTVYINAECTMALTDADRPEPCDAFEMERGVSRIALHQLKVLIRERSNRRR